MVVGIQGLIVDGTRKIPRW